MPPSLNTSNPAVKRILSEVKKMQTDTSDQFEAHPVEDDLFDWHFVLRGPADTPFEGGIYHGRIILPPQYPYKPPEFMFLCPQGRFEVGKKICLTISQHHPEMWQPSWDIRTALTAIQSFMPSPGNGAIAALDYNDAERRALASKSKEATRATLASHSMLDAFADFLDAPPPASGGGAAAAGGARRGAEGAAAVEISTPPQQPQQQQQQQSAAATPDAASDTAAPLFSPKPRDEPQRPPEQPPSPAPTPASAPSPAPSPAPEATRSPAPQAAPCCSPAPSTPTAPASNPPAPAPASSGTSTLSTPTAAGGGAAAAAGGGDPPRPAYAPATYAPARAPQAQAQRNRADREGQGRTVQRQGSGVQRQGSGRALAPPPSDDEVLLGHVAVFLVTCVALLAARRAAVTLFPEVQWMEVAQGVLQEVLLLVQDLFSDAPQSTGEL